MKFILSESQYEKLGVHEQSMAGWGANLPSGTASEVAKGWSDALDPHTLLTVAQIGTAFIPMIGPFISAGLGLVDAAVYYKQGDTKTAGLVGILSLLPGIGSVVNKIPGVKKFGEKGMVELAKKISFGSKLSREEKMIVSQIAQNQSMIKTEMKSLSQKLLSSASKTRKIATTTAKEVIPYVAAGAAYEKGYDYVQRDTPKTKSEKEGYDWNTVKIAFGSSGSEEDNSQLSKAWEEGWRPGQIVPKKYQTELFRINYEEELKNIQSLKTLLTQKTQ